MAARELCRATPSPSRCRSGRIAVNRIRWQTIFDARDKPSIYRIHNGSGRSAVDPGNAMIVEVDGAKRTIKVNAGTSVDVMAKKIRVKAGTGGETSWVKGWYVLVPSSPGAPRQVGKQRVGHSRRLDRGPQARGGETFSPRKED